MKYKDKLKHPKWQKKRLAIMERDNFSCSCCASTTRTLNVHHLYYIDGADPWSYKDEALITLCEQCHLREEKTMPIELAKLNMALKNSCVPSWMVSLLVSTFTQYLDKPKEASRFIVDMNIEANKRNKTIDLEYLSSIARTLRSPQEITVQ